MRTDVTVGVVVICAVVLIAVMWAWLSGLTGGRATYEVIVCATDSQGIKEGQPVTVAGVQVGKVARVALEDHGYPDRPAAIHLLIKDEGDTPGALRETDRFRIESGALLGEKYVRVISGPVPRGRRLRQGDVVLAEEPPPTITEITTSAGDLIATLNDIADKIDTALGRQNEWSADVTDTLENLNRASQDTRSMAASLKDVVERADLRLDSVMDNLDATSANFRLASSTVNQFVATTSIPSDAEAALASVREATEHIEHLATRLDEIGSDDQTSRDIRETLDNVRKASESVARVGTKAEDIADRGREVMDTTTEVSENALKVSDNLVGASKDAREAAGHARNIMSRWDRRMARTEERLGSIEVEPRVEVTYGFDSADFQLDADLFFRHRGSDRQIVLGLRDFGAKTDLDLQYAQWLTPRRRFRAGLIGGDLGAALDEDFGGPWSMTLEAYDQDAVRLDVTAARELRPTMHLLFGVDDAFGQFDPFVGTRYKW